MKNFFTDIKRSLSDWQWYKEIAAGQHKQKVTYILGLSLIISLVFSIAFTVSLYTYIIPESRNFINNELPADLIITIKSGELSINQPTPYRFQIPAGTEKEQAKDKVNFIVIDPSAEALLDATNKYETFVFATKDTVIMENKLGETRAYPVKDFPDSVVSRESINHFIDSVSPYAWIVPILTFIFLTIFNFIGILISVLISGFLLWIVFKISSRKVRFADAFALCMYAYTFIFIFKIILVIFRFRDFGVFSSIFLTVLIATLIIFIPRSHHIEISYHDQTK